MEGELIKPSLPSLQQIKEDIANEALLQEGMSKEDPVMEENTFYNKLKQLESQIERQNELSKDLDSLSSKLSEHAEVLKKHQDMTLEPLEYKIVT